MVDAVFMQADSKPAELVSVRARQRPAYTKLASGKEHLGDRPIEGLALSGKLARPARRAIRAQKAKGLAVTYKRGNKIIKEFVDGREEILGTVESSVYKLPKNVRIIGK